MAPRKKKTHKAQSSKKVPKAQSSKKDKSNHIMKIDWRGLFKTEIQEQIEEVCWAISIAATIEARYNKEMDEVKNQLSLSSQCMINSLIEEPDDDHTMPAYSKVHKFLGSKGLCTTDICPFEGRKSIKEKNLPKGDRVFTYEPKVIEKINEDDIMEVISKKGPVMGVLCVCDAFYNLKEDIYRGPTSTRVDRHSVCIIGYGTMEGIDFWMIRNSFGITWGESGYGKLIQKSSRSEGGSLFEAIWYPKPMAQSKRYVVKNGAPQLIPLNPVSFITSNILSAQSKAKMLLEPFLWNKTRTKQSSEVSDENLQESVGQFFRRHFGEEFCPCIVNAKSFHASSYIEQFLFFAPCVVDYLIDPFVAGTSAGDPESLSVSHAFPELWSLEKNFDGSSPLSSWSISYAAHDADIMELKKDQIFDAVIMTVINFNE
ncbi:protoporphyrinogen oxidase, chloroplastic/mitochondrial [Canna indica]|uniref:Protoporphyrinogen oxidase, chloroplastic/mitochondrial n=1 Tax=Canna indica TaxID=4628 RepID=A0AAQ3QB08_9LILI|nr:protoporphyrinogen oxidase, chloroplastic/mitochondrial [Canna indica]